MSNASTPMPAANGAITQRKPSGKRGVRRKPLFDESRVAFLLHQRRRQRRDLGTACPLERPVPALGEEPGGELLDGRIGPAVQREPHRRLAAHGRSSRSSSRPSNARPARWATAAQSTPDPRARRWAKCRRSPAGLFDHQSLADAQARQVRRQVQRQFADGFGTGVRPPVVAGRRPLAQLAASAAGSASRESPRPVRRRARISSPRRESRGPLRRCGPAWDRRSNPTAGPKRPLCPTARRSSRPPDTRSPTDRRCPTASHPPREPRAGQVRSRARRVPGQLRTGGNQRRTRQPGLRSDKSRVSWTAAPQFIALRNAVSRHHCKIGCSLEQPRIQAEVPCLSDSDAGEIGMRRVEQVVEFGVDDDAWYSENRGRLAGRPDIPDSLQFLRRWLGSPAVPSSAVQTRPFSRKGCGRVSRFVDAPRRPTQVKTPCSRRPMRSSTSRAPISVSTKLRGDSPASAVLGASNH